MTAYLVSGQIEIETDVDTTSTGIKIPLYISINKFSPVDSFRITLYRFNDGKVVNSEVDFEISDFGRWKGNSTSLTPEGKTSNLTDTINIRIWDEGTFIVVPLFNYQTPGEFNFSSGKFALINILPSTDPADSLKNLAPIKDIFREKKLFKDFIRWYHIFFVSLLLVATGIIIYLKYRKKPGLIPDAEQRTDEVSPFSHAILRLEELKKEKIWLKGRIKEFHQQLTYILREYLEKKYNIKALEQSTSEIIQSLDETINEKEHFDIITEILHISDMIKFAKASMGENLNEKFLDRTIDLINDLHNS
ncbi:MAG: hypothetical protein ACM3PT_08255 [Deltaproteobacteria bacterium]